MVARVALLGIGLVAFVVAALWNGVGERPPLASATVSVKATAVHPSTPVASPATTIDPSGPTAAPSSETVDVGVAAAARKRGPTANFEGLRRNLAFELFIWRDETDRWQRALADRQYVRLAAMRGARMRDAARVQQVYAAMVERAPTLEVHDEAVEEFAWAVESVRSNESLLFGRYCPAAVGRRQLQDVLDGLVTAETANDDGAEAAIARQFATLVEGMVFADDAVDVLAEIRRRLTKCDDALAARVGGVKARTRLIRRLRDDVADLTETLGLQAGNCMVPGKTGEGLTYDPSVALELPAPATIDRIAREIEDVDALLVQLDDRQAFQRELREPFRRQKYRYELLAQRPSAKPQSR